MVLQREGEEKRADDEKTKAQETMKGQKKRAIVIVLAFVVVSFALLG